MNPLDEGIDVSYDEEYKGSWLLVVVVYSLLVVVYSSYIGSASGVDPWSLASLENL